MTLQDEDGAWVDRWNSSTLERSSQLPVQAELQLALSTGDAPDAAADPFADPTPLVRRVLLPIRPLSLDPDGEGSGADDGDEDDADDEGTDDADCITVGECRAANPGAFQVLAIDPQLGALADSLADQCFAQHAASLGVDTSSLVDLSLIHI